MLVLPPDEKGLREALRILHCDGIVAHATETCYGFACDLTNEEAVRKLFILKQRPEHLPVSALFSSVEEAQKYVEWNEQAEELARKHFPGPLTIILPMRRDAPQRLFMVPLPAEAVREPSLLQATSYKPQARTIGIRLSSHPVAQKLAELCGFPLSTTSANVHGKPEPYHLKEFLSQFPEDGVQPDLFLDSGALPHAPPSTVVLLEKEGIKVVRRGSINVQ